MQGTKNENSNLKNIANILAWPITAAADSFQYLNHSSPMAVSSFGINNIICDNVLSLDLNDDKSFEFNINALSTHIAAALQSTYFPFLQSENGGKVYSDVIVSNIMGDFLKMYWYDADNLQNISRTYDQNIAENNYLKMFECKHNLSITKVASLADDYHTPQGFRDILFRLESMDEVHRKNKINEYNNLLFELAESPSSNSKDPIQFMLGSTGFLPISYALSIVLTLIGIIKEKVDTSEFMQKEKEMNLISKLIKDSGIKVENQLVEDIYLLDKISRVAILK